MRTSLTVDEVSKMLENLANKGHLKLEVEEGVMAYALREGSRILLLSHLTTPTGRAMAGLLAVFAEFERDLLRERVEAGVAEAREQDKPHGRPRTAALLHEQVEEMHEGGA